MTYFLAPALVRLRDEVNDQFPRRDKASDGWIGDPSHAARKSDHNPDWDAGGRFYGIVRALDIDISPDGDPDEDLRRQLLNVVVGDPRVWYVISNGIIYSRTYGFRAMRYTGSNGHYAHVHVSLRHFFSEFDTAAWFAPQPKFVPRKISLPTVQDAFKDAVLDKPWDGDGRVHVRRVQKALNHKYDMSLVTDGYVGEKTLNAWGRHERRRDGQGRPRVPDEVSLRKLVAPNYQLMVGE